MFVSVTATRDTLARARWWRVIAEFVSGIKPE